MSCHPSREAGACTRKHDFFSRKFGIHPVILFLIKNFSGKSYILVHMIAITYAATKWQESDVCSKHNGRTVVVGQVDIVEVQNHEC
jgi:hypothetical protein